MVILTGLGLSMAFGLRVFTPLLVASIAAKTGNLELADGFKWLGEWPLSPNHHRDPSIQSLPHFRRDLNWGTVGMDGLRDPHDS